MDAGATKALAGKSTYEKHKEFVSKTAPHLKSVEESGKTKFAVANGRVSHSIVENRRDAISAASKFSVVPNRPARAVPAIQSTDEVSRSDVRHSGRNGNSHHWKEQAVNAH